MSMLKTSVYMAIDVNMLKAPCKKAENILAIQIEKDTQPFVPARTGSLSQRTYVEDNVIIYSGPYARYLYNGKLMVDPNTGSSYAPKGGTKVLTDKNLVFSQAVHPQAQSHWFEASKAQNMDKWERVYRKAVQKEL